MTKNIQPYYSQQTAQNIFNNTSLSKQTNNDHLTSFEKNYTCEVTNNTNVRFDNFLYQNKHNFPSDLIHVKRTNYKKILTDQQVEKMIYFDNTGNLKPKKTLTKENVKEIIKWAFDDMYFAKFNKEEIPCVPISSWAYNQYKNGGSLNLTNTWHTGGVFDKNGKLAQTSNLKEQLQKFLIENNVYPYPYSFAGTILPETKIYLLDNSVNILDTTFLNKYVNTTKTTSYNKVIKVIQEQIDIGNKLNKTTSLILPMSIVDKEHAIWSAVCYFPETKSLKYYTCNSNGLKEAKEKYHSAFSKIIKKNFNDSYNVEDFGLHELGFQKGPYCIECAYKTAKQAASGKHYGAISQNEIIYGAFTRMQEVLLANTLGIETDTGLDYLSTKIKDKRTKTNYNTNQYHKNNPYQKKNTEKQVLFDKKTTTQQDKFVI